MTTLKSSQLGSMPVSQGASNLNASQLGTVSVSSNPAAVGLNSSQLFTVAVISNNKTFQPLNAPVQLGCWTPCGVLLWNGV